MLQGMRIVYSVRQPAQVRIVLHICKSGKLVVKPMFYEEKQDSGYERSYSKTEGTAVLYFVCV